MKSISVLFFSLALLVITFSSVIAQTATPTNNVTPTGAITTTPSRRPTGSIRPTGRGNACIARQNALRTRAQNVTRHVETLTSKFESITKRVDEFYKNKIVPQGRTVSNYTQLIAQIETNKVKVKSALDKAKTTLASFNCDNNPRGTMQQFRTDMQAVISALKAYKTSVRNLIVAVHRATPDTSVTPGLTGTVSVIPTTTTTPTP